MINYFARHPTAANLLMIALILIGVLSLPDLQRETYPEFESDVIQIRASYPGADAQTMDETVVARIEDVLGGLEGVETISASSREGSASVSVEVSDGFEAETLLTDIESAVNGINDFPSDMDDPSVSLQSRARSVASIAVTGAMSGQDLKLYLERLARRLLSDPDISQVSVAGFSTHRLQISLDQVALSRYGLDVSGVADAIAAQSLDSPLGELQLRGRTLLVRYEDKRVSPDELRSVVVATGDSGGEILLGDVATVEDAFSDEAEQTYFNGERAGMLVVSKASTEDSLEVLAAMERFIDEQEPLKPDGVEFQIINDTTSVIEDRLGLLLSNGLQGLLLVFLTLWLFFDLRLAFWVVAGMPVAFLSALWVMSMTGQSLNMMTMMGLLVAIGLLMDDAIVLAENVASQLEAGKAPLEATIVGVREVAGGILSSFATTICVFVPLSAIDGRIGRTLQVIPVVLIAVLAMSLVEAFLILPNHLGHSLRPRGRRSAMRQRFDDGFEWLRERGLGRAVDFVVRHRYAAVSLGLAAFLVALGAVQGGKLSYQAFPDAEGDVVEFRLEMPAGTSLEATKRETDRVVAAAMRVSDRLSSEQPEGQALVRNSSVRFNYNSAVDASGPHLATVSLDLLSVEVRETTLSEFTDAWREELGSVANAISANFGAGGRSGPSGNAIEVRVAGDDLERLDEAAAKVEDYFAAIDGVSDLGDDLELDTAQIRVRLRPGIGTPGLTGATVASQIKAALAGVSVENLLERGEEFEVFVELERNHRDTIADLEILPIRLQDGTWVPLGSIALIDQSRSYGTVKRREGARTVTVSGALDREQVNLAALMAEFSDTGLAEISAEYSDLEFSIGGEIEDSATTLGSMAQGALLGMLAIFAVLSLQLRTYIEPMLVMLAIPFAFVGVVAGSMLIGAPLSSQSILGFVSLAGIVVNDSILLMLFIKRARAGGMSVIAAATKASRERFRAVLLTSATTIAGLVPLMFETSRQAQMLIPVATSIVFGLAASTVLVLVLLPAAYVLLADLGLLGAGAEPDSELEAPSAP
ncbi:putative efflux pump membrane transporter TtgB [Enhygromyxa salina]|uniref:Putative efflux pump membrane transporter TtgB n=1 Tax=Enhygromyxa salina TaxID=215803 RepID=A0A2S9XBB0_9BACT|nr:efflux RND transporter permease subunit [Enhygromyxa salina]PRP90144.1 putative efflux pump membrane transporter TtgB [Enhygromyxa salina]